jgi:hypothetical protein
MFGVFVVYDSLFMLALRRRSPSRPLTENLDPGTFDGAKKIRVAMQGRQRRHMEKHSVPSSAQCVADILLMSPALPGRFARFLAAPV